MNHGEWIKKTPKVYKCSICGRYALEWGGVMIMSNYCPNCGAKMEGEAEYYDRWRDCDKTIAILDAISEKETENVSRRTTNPEAKEMGV